MKKFIYDGSFSGFLTAVYESYYSGRPDSIETEEAAAAVIFRAEIEITVVTDEKKADKVIRAVREKISPAAARNTELVFLSSVSGRENLLHRYLRKGFRKGPVLDDLIMDEDVASVGKISRSVSFEAHRFEGLLRFRETENGFLYGPLEPDNDIVSLLAGHFRGRLGRESWVIHDLKRRKAAVCRNGEITIVGGIGEKFLPDTERETEFSGLWGNFYEKTGLKERYNPGLRRQFLPLKYRKHLTERDRMDQ